MGDLRNWLLFLLKPLMNERGEIGEGENQEEEGTGETQVEETEETTEETTEEAAEETEETTETEPKLEDGYIVYPDGNKIPVDRFEKVYGQGKEHERNLSETQEKLNLLQTDPEEYYKKFPDEKPEAETVSTQPKIGEMRVTGGEYDGMTLAEVYNIDPVEAQSIQFNYQMSQRDAQTKTRDTEARMLEEINAEMESFSQARAKDFFDKEFSALTEAELSQLNTLTENVIAWGKETGRGSGKIEDIYFLMHKDTLLSAEKGKGIQALINGQVKSVPSTAGGGKVDTGTETGYSRFLNMSEDQMATAIDDMSDAEYLKFKKEAPAALKKKHHGLPWN